MICVMIEIFRKLNVRKRKLKQEWSLIQSVLWAQVSQLTFIYLLTFSAPRGTDSSFQPAPSVTIVLFVVTAISYQVGL